MIFSDLYKSPRSPFNKLRHSIPSVTLPATDLEADLISRDKTRQKEAVKKFLNEKIRCDWEFTWPPPDSAHKGDRLENSPTPAGDGAETCAKIEGTGGDSLSSVPAASPTFDEDTPRDPGEEADSESDAESIYSTVSEDQLHFHPRIEWTSDISDDELPVHPSSPFRFDTPDAVGTAVQTSINERKARRRRAVRDEISWNVGLACFEARRDAWTGAKTVRVKPKPATPISPSSTRRLSFWRHHRSESTASQNAALGTGSPPISSPLSPTSTNFTQTPSEPDSSNASKIHSTSSRDSAAHALYPVETLIPVAPPLLPPQNPMRASVTPSIYPSLYDKIVVHSLQPSCPVNLGDMLRACVVGWKRDGEWPPKSTIQVVPMHGTAAEVMVLRHQRKASQAQAKHARKASTATNGSSRRLSFVGFLGGGGNKNTPGVEKERPATIPQHHEEKEGPAANANGGKDTHSDEANSGGGTGKGIRRSLQKVFSLGQHGHHGHPAAPGETAISPTKEVTAAG